MSLILRVIALVLFILGALSAFTDVDLNEVGLVAAGLAAWVASTLVTDDGRVLNRT
jgi:hypothetical protein